MKKWIFSLALVGGLWVGAGLAAASGSPSSVAQIVRLADGGNWTMAANIAGKSDATTRTIYEWLNLLREDSDQPLPRYLAFLQDHGDWPLNRRIRAHAEQVLGDHPAARDVLALYANAEPVSARGALALARALQETGQADDARMRLNDWFVDAGLVKPEQDLIMNQGRAWLAPESLARRLDHLLNDGQDEMARALAARMGGDAGLIVRSRSAMSDKSPQAAGLLAQIGGARDAGVIFEQMKWLRRTDRLNEARDLLLRLPHSFLPYNSRSFWNEQETIVELLLDAGQIIPAYQIATRDFHDDRYARAQVEWWGGYIAYAYLHQPGRAFRHFDKLYRLSRSPLTRARAAYWAGRASEDLKYADVAQVWYRTAATYSTNFYGQLAAARLGHDGHISPARAPEASAQDRAIFEQSDLVQAARLLGRSGARDRAALFIWRLADIYENNAGITRLVVDLALGLKLMPEAVKISRKAAIQGIDFAGYVYPTIGDIAPHGIEPALMYAIIRQESAFDAEAISSSGARGLMQLMPSTAKALARQEKLKHNVNWLTARPSYNARLGSQYLRDLVDQYNGSYAFAAAAYNAGPSRVTEWVRAHGDPRRGEISWADWIERIPLNETRNYVQRILEGVVVYRQKLRDHARPPVDHLR